MSKGTIYLDYEGEPQFKLEVTHLVLRTNEVMFDFSGSDEGAPYSGSCQLRQVGDTFKGDARYRYARETGVYGARVALTLQPDGDELTASGTWTDENETEPYDLHGEFCGDGS